MDILSCVARLWVPCNLGPCLRVLLHPSGVRFLQSDVYFQLWDHDSGILTGEAGTEELVCRKR